MIDPTSEHPQNSTTEKEARTSGSGQKAAPAPAGEQKNPNELTPDEQMENFEKELKENDWGHQPC